MVKKMMSKTKTKTSSNLLQKNLLYKVIFSLILTTLFTYAQAQKAVIGDVYVAYPSQSGNIALNYCNGSIPVTGGIDAIRSFYEKAIAPVSSTDPTVNSALIEFDKPFNWGASAGPDGDTGYRYPNHCLYLCMDIQCSSSSSPSNPSPSFPIESARFEIFKFLEQNNPNNEQSSPPIRTMQMFPTTGAYKCAGYQWTFAATGEVSNTSIRPDLSGGGYPTNLTCNDGGACTETNGTKIDDSSNKLTFCTAWDGSYNFDSEFAKTNGTFGIRANIQSSYQPPPTLSESPIEINQTATYPAANQQPIMVDVTDVHSVRATPTVVGKLDAVFAQPYDIKYRLSKDALVTMKIFDGSRQVPIITDPATSGYNAAYLKRTLIQNEPRLGERSPDGGQTSDNNNVALIEVEHWDGRDDTARLLPRGNYLVSTVATATDEWNTDTAREKTYQISLDPLKITDIQEIGLNKQSTGIAQVNYLLTEAATSYFRVYPPGTTITDMYTPGTGKGTPPAVSVGAANYIYSSTEQKGSRETVNTKWDGTCNNPNGCTLETIADSTSIKVYANGASIVAADNPVMCANSSCDLNASFAKDAQFPATSYAGAAISIWNKVGYGSTLPAGSTAAEATAILLTVPSGDNYTINDKCLSANGCAYEKTYVNNASIPAGTCNYDMGCTITNVRSATLPYAPTTVNVGYGATYTSQLCYSTAGCKLQNAYTQGSTITAADPIIRSSYVSRQYAANADISGLTCGQSPYCKVSSTIASGAAIPANSYCNQATCNADSIFTFNNGIPIPLPATCQSTECQILTTTGSATTETKNYAYGQYVPDGDYVYVLWAEIPYASTYTNMNGDRFDGVKSRLYHNGILPVNRGQVDINIQAIEYATIGSSPIAYGLDPFVFKYTISRDAPTTVTIKNSANVTVKTLAKDQQTVEKQVNTLTWDGIDDYGRYVADGTYVLEITAKDPIFTDIIYSRKSLFPVDLFRVVDVTDTPLLSDTLSKATLSYSLSKVMDVSVYIYEKGTVIPNDKTVAWPPVDADGRVNAGVSVNAMPIKTFRGTRPGEGNASVESWDGTRDADSSFVSDGQYPYIIVARPAQEATIYYDQDANPILPANFAGNAPADLTLPAGSRTGGYGVIYSTDHPTGYITVARGPVYFLDEVTITAASPQLVNSTGTAVRIPPYTINFTPSRTAKVDIDVLSPNGKDCYGNYVSGNDREVCRVLRDTGFNEYGEQNIYEGNLLAKVQWDGRDDRGNYLASGLYTVRLRANGYPFAVNSPVYTGKMTLCTESGTNSTYNKCTTAQKQLIGVCPDGKDGVWDATNPSDRKIICDYNYEVRVEVPINANIFQIYDRDIEVISERNQAGAFFYQASVPMKVAIQIFKPGTRINNYSTGEVIGPDDQTAATLYCDEVTGVPKNCATSEIDDPATVGTGCYLTGAAGSGQQAIYCPGPNVSSERDLLVKAIVGMRPNAVSIQEVWDGKDFAMQDVPDGTYPFRYVTTAEDNSTHIDSFYGDISDTKYIADWSVFGNMVGWFTVARGDGRFVCEDFKKATIFYPNPFRANTGKFEVTKIPVPGELTIKIYNIAGDLVRTSGYQCTDVNNNTITVGSSIAINPDNNIKDATKQTDDFTNLRNAALRCEWDKKNDHGKTVARGVYLALIDFKATGGGKEYCQKVVKILIP
ncbi:flagellar hook assembly protein FlgD [Elusimicrobium simillimum]|uniref:FlgD immunoglobulin-like domain containing protein n=1 Tax=Elusimicrobium simillimum TaxID=3143438 RepID=UPI003C6FE24E